MTRDGVAPSVFVGREAELEVLSAQLARATAGVSPVVVVEGPAGIGKTALTRRFLAGSGPRLLWASGEEGESRLAYGVLNQLAGGADAGSWLTPRPREDPLVVGTRLLEFLDALQDQEAVTLVVDDAHWADTPSLQALSFTLRRLQADCVLAVFVTRDSALLPENVRRLLDTDRGLIVRLGGLDAAEVGELAKHVGVTDLPLRAVERLCTHTGGNPLYARALLDELDPRVLARTEGVLPAPRSFGLVVLARLASVSTPARHLVEAAAILGRRCSLGLAAAVAELADPAAPLEEVVAAGLLEVPEPLAPVTVTFPHALVASAIYHDLSSTRRSALHARAAALLDHPAALEHRVAAALVENDELAAELAAYAGEEANQGALAAAAVHLQAAARLSRHQSARDRFLVEVVDLLLRAGEVAEALGLAPELDQVADTARRRFVLGHLALLTGRHGEAEELLRGAWERADPDAEADVATLASGLLCQLCAIQVRAEEAVTWGRRSLECAPELAATGLSTLAVYLALLGRDKEALTVVSPAAEYTRPHHARDIDALLGRGTVRLWIGELATAREDLSRVVEDLRPHLTSRTALLALAYLAEAHYRLGAWEDSVVQANLAVSLAGDAGQVWMLGFLNSQAVYAPAARGQWEAADAYLGAAEAVAHAGGLAGQGYVGAARVHLATCRGEPARAVEAALGLLGLPRREGIDEPGVFTWREQYVDALIALRRLEEAAGALVAYEALAHRRGRKLAMAGAGRVRGNLEAARGRPERARAAFDVAFSHLDDVPAPFDRALLEDAYGRFLRRVGERRAAAARLEAAREGFAALRAGPFMERVERELAACGLSPRRRSGNPALDLTPQELAVARLVAAGGSNREVAAELVVSVKTVGYHLGNVYAKLGVSSRSQLAARFATSPR